MAYFLALTAALTAPQNGGAEQGSQMITADPKVIADVFESLGYKTTITTYNQGDPQIVADDGTPNNAITVLFRDCDSYHSKCSSVEFFYASTVKKESQWYADWNSKNRYVFSYSSSQNFSIIEMDVNLNGGTTRNNFVGYINIWTTASASFKMLINR